MQLLTKDILKKIRGFTLIEVMVALLIVAIALAALSMALGQTVYQQGTIENRVVATWVAQNRMIEIQQAQETGGKIEKTFDVVMAKRNWQTTLSLEPTLVPDIQKAKLQVFLKGEDHTSATLWSVLGHE
ncbi:MAG: type II secretion system minor pseudopilin GspI [Hydrogenovibrio crunogenus]|uniref:Type II secretion system protein I n=1 Tax=Hydrogenovibrio crunogenus (strain DSM 25203 / XCL-2) TaxID=317025 RepID=Q31J22_HYDCU|nr:type II secretion system minor pseudopilin GspI [Hydrogenovibrio crunogenus]